MSKERTVARLFTAEAFNAWLKRRGLSGMAAARVLGCSQITVSSYRKLGAPYYIGLACAAIEHDLGLPEVDVISDPDHEHVGTALNDEPIARMARALCVADGRDPDEVVNLGTDEVEAGGQTYTRDVLVPAWTTYASEARRMIAAAGSMN